MNLDAFKQPPAEVLALFGEPGREPAGDDSASTTGVVASARPPLSAATAA